MGNIYGKPPAAYIYSTNQLVNTNPSKNTPTNKLRLNPNC